MGNTKKKLLHSLLMLFLCFSMFVGSTFAWFSETIASRNNVIVSGNLDVEMYWTDALVGDDTVWTNVETSDVGVFNSDNWEPGYTEVKYLRIVNKGNLAFKYQLNLLSLGEVGKLAEVIDVYSTQLEKDANTSPFGSRAQIDSMTKTGVLSEVAPNNTTFSEGILLPVRANNDNFYCGESIVAVALHMQEEAGNKYQNETIGDGFSIQVVATQFEYESDSFGNDYDSGAFFPRNYLPVNISTNISGLVENGVLAQEVVISGPYGIGVTIPAGVKVSNDQTLALIISEKENSEANVKLGENDALKAFDVHVEGIASDNTVPMIVRMGEVLPTGLNKGNLDLYHVENSSNKMSEVNDITKFNKHNQFVYEPATGELTLNMATFSEVAIVADTTSAWEGNFDYSWYNARSVESDYIIANADQLAAFGAIVGGMNGQTQDSFAGKTVKLVGDINLGDAEKNNDADKIFYPIGYYNSTGSYEKVSGGSVTSSVFSFEGTFDGNGHTISNFYQNTWEMFGDYNDGYSGTPNHYDDAMGLFGYVVNGTVKNLTVDNFSSDGEFTPTGVIAAYAVNSTFENIAITNCNPRVYNTGNGGIVGIGGNSDDSDTYKLTFNNITIDSSNKITALWGSWDVACGGLVGMFRGAGSVDMKNCHVAAQMDVYNDVCGNYQYYWYRYSGMMVGTNKNMITDKDGYTVPETSKFHAEGCTVHFGEWNDYYYCELVANSLASYTHDHQFSRLEQITNLDDIKSGDTWTKAGNFLLISEDTKTCYHIVKNADGTLKQHLHTDAGEETVNGETVLKENNQIIYLPFNQLFTGYGWGVKHIPIYDDGTPNPFEGVTILGREVADSHVKFDKVKEDFTELENNVSINIGDLFKAANISDSNLYIKSENVQVTVSAANDLSNVSGEYFANTSDWTKGTLKLSGTGDAIITITDYYFCTPTILKVKVKELEKAFDLVFENTDKYIYRVGNNNSVQLGSLFKAKDGVTIDTANIEIEIYKSDDNIEVDNTEVDKTKYGFNYTSNPNWSKGTIQFADTGYVIVEIKAQTGASTKLKLEVVDAVNATSATSAKSNNVVLLNDVSLSTLEVSNGYTLYGNGFKMEAKNDIMYDAMNAGYVVVRNGTLDNVQIICPNFSHSIVYNKHIKDGNDAVPSDSSNDARGNVRSAVMVDGNSKILNSYVHGGRAAVFLRSGNLLIDNSTISGGAAANIHAINANSLTLRNATLIQKPFKANVNNTDKTIMGFSGLFECDENGNSTPLILEGELIQKAWVNSSYAQYVPKEAESILDKILTEDQYKSFIHQVGEVNSFNLGFAFIPQDIGGKTSANVDDNRANKDSVPYKTEDIDVVLTNATVYTYTNANGTNSGFNNQDEVYKPNNQGSTTPVLSFDAIDDNTLFETKFNANTNRWESTLTVNLDNGDYSFNFNNLIVNKHGNKLPYTVIIEDNAEDNTEVDKEKPIELTTSGVTSYIITAQDNSKNSNDGTHKFYFKLVATKTSIKEPEVLDTTGGTPLLVVKSKNSDWSCAIPALEGIKIKYYTAGGEEVLDLATLTPTSTGKQNGTNNYWETTKDGYKLKVTCGYIHDTKQIYGMPVVVNNSGNKMYFTISSTNGYVSTSTSGRTVKITYEFTDPNGKTLTFSKTWQFNYADYKNGKQYSYSDFVNGTLKEASSTCVTPETLITLFDGTQVQIKDLKGNELLLVWNHTTGKLDKAPVAYIVNHDAKPKEYEVTTLTYSDGSQLEIIGEHVFYDWTLNKYVTLDSNAEKFIGHAFAKTNNDLTALNKVYLTNVENEIRLTSAYEVVSYEHITCFTNGVLSASAYLDKILNVFDINEDTLSYSKLGVIKDILTYGLYSYEDFEGLIDEAAFNMYNAKYLKVAVGKGLITWEDIINLINIYYDVEVEPIQ